MEWDRTGWNRERKKGIDGAEIECIPYLVSRRVDSLHDSNGRNRMELVWFGLIFSVIVSVCPYCQTQMPHMFRALCRSKD